jgi:hypothetical protein
MSSKMPRGYSGKLLGALISFALGTTTLGGCAVGLDSVLFVTKTGVSIDADTQPASLDFGYAREEFVLQPIYEGGQSLPVLTTVGVEGTGLTFGANHSFATGPSAVVMADAFDSKERYVLGAEGGVPKPRMDGKIVTTLPNDIPGGFDPFGWISYFFSSDANRKRYFFGTDTNLGLHVEWGGNDIPRSVSIGYKRKELAYVPLIEQPSYVNTLAADKPAYTPPQMEGMVAAKVRLDPTGRPWVATTADPQSAADFKRFDKAREGDGAAPEGELISMEEAIRRGAISSSSTVGLASLIATADVGTRVAGFKNTGARVNQTFATGAAATLLATQPGIRRALGPVLIPNWDEAKAPLNLSSGDTVAKMDFLEDVYDQFIELAAEGDTTAADFKRRWDALVTTADRASYSEYRWLPETDDPPGTLVERTVAVPSRAATDPFILITQRWANAGFSRESIGDALQEEVAGKKVFLYESESAAPSDQPKAIAYRDRAAADEAKATLKKAQDDLEAQKEVVAKAEADLSGANSLKGIADDDLNEATSADETAKAKVEAAPGDADLQKAFAEATQRQKEAVTKATEATDKVNAAKTKVDEETAKVTPLETAVTDATTVADETATISDESWEVAKESDAVAKRIEAGDPVRDQLTRVAKSFEDLVSEAEQRLENDPAIAAGVDYFVALLKGPVDAGGK